MNVRPVVERELRLAARQKATYGNGSAPPSFFTADNGRENRIAWVGKRS